MTNQNDQLWLIHNTALTNCDQLRPTFCKECSSHVNGISCLLSTLPQWCYKSVIGSRFYSGVVPSCWQVNYTAKEILDALSNMIYKKKLIDKHVLQGKKLSVGEKVYGYSIMLAIWLFLHSGTGPPIETTWFFTAGEISTQGGATMWLDYWGPKAPGSCYYALLGSPFPYKTCLRVCSSMKAEPTIGGE